jgi:hypothetical protein
VNAPRARGACAAAWALVALVSVGDGGCASRPPPLPPGAPVPLRADDPLLATLVEGWSERVDRREALHAAVVLKLSGPDGERRLSQDVVLARPARLRMEIQSFLMTAAVLVADGSQYEYFQSIDRYHERGAVHPRLLFDIAGVPLTLEQAVDFLLGGPPERVGLLVAGGERLPDGSVSVDLRDAADRLARRLRFGPAGHLERVEEWSAAGQLRWQVGYDRYREVGEDPFAHTIEFEFPPLAASAVVAFRSVELNPATTDATFQLVLPAEPEAPSEEPGAEEGPLW